MILELVDFVELTKDKSVQIRFIEFMPFNGNKWSWSKGVGFPENDECNQLSFWRRKGDTTCWQSQ